MAGTATAPRPFPAAFAVLTGPVSAMAMPAFRPIQAGGWPDLVSFYR
jgi:hypothetical protein